MSPTFHPFPRLPAELRAYIWALTLTESHALLKGRNRIIEFKDYNTELEEVAVKISSSFPALFHVNREARYEAVKLDGGEWVTIHARFDGRKEPGHTATFELYINHSRDTIYLSERFTTVDTESLSLHACKHPEELRLKLFCALLPNTTVPKIQRILLAAASNPHNNTHWRGTGLSAFPSLTYFHAFSHDWNYINALRQAVQTYVENLWRGRSKDRQPRPLLAFTLGNKKAALWDMQENERLEVLERELEGMEGHEEERAMIMEARGMLGAGGGL